MPLVTRHSLMTVVVLLLAAVLATAIFIWFGIYNIGADDTHTRPVYAMLETLRERSIEARSKKLHPPPDLTDASRISRGAGNYNAMCTGCHLAPGMGETELSKGLNPAPPNLANEPVDAAEAFWVIKHGVKASGMPAWGKSMQDEDIWGMVAFLQKLPGLSAEQYLGMVAASGGHSHGGGETRPQGLGNSADEHHGDTPMEGMPVDESAPHGHARGTPPHDDAPVDATSGMTMDGNAMHEDKPHPHTAGTPPDHHKPPPDAPSSQAPGTVQHRHADGTVESHPALDAPPADASNHH